MTKAALIDMKRVSKQYGDDDVLQILDRLEKLSKRPENPGLAYRNLETINALVNTLREKLGQEAAGAGH